VDSEKYNSQLVQLWNDIQDESEIVGARPSMPLLSKLIEDTYNQGKDINCSFFLFFIQLL